MTIQQEPGVVANVLWYIVVLIALVLGVGNCLVNGSGPPSEYTLEREQAYKDAAAKEKCTKLSASGQADYISCLKRHGLIK